MKNLSIIAGVAALAITGCGTATGGSTGSEQQQPAAAGGQTQAQSEPATPTIDLSLSNDNATVYSNRYVLRGTVTRGARVVVEGDRANVRGHRWSVAVRLRGTGEQPFTVTADKQGWESAQSDVTLTRKLTSAERAARERARAARAAAREQARAARAAARERARVARQQAASGKRALESAQSYLEVSGMSKQGLIEQLSSSAGEGFPMADAIWAVDHVQVDWNQEAVEAAKSYLEMSPMSKSALIEQLSSSAGEGFTLAQATYGANQAY
jgi:hypothetical protein